MVKYICVPTIFSNIIVLRVNAELRKRGDGSSFYYIDARRIHGTNNSMPMKSLSSIPNYHDPSLFFDTQEEALKSAKELIKTVRSKKAAKLLEKSELLKKKAHDMLNKPGAICKISAYKGE